MARLLDRTEVERRIETGEFADWKTVRYESFDATMSDGESPYPCYFAVDAHAEGHLRYLFPETSGGDGGRRAVAEGLDEYLSVAPAIADVTSLVVLFEPPTEDRSAEWFKSRFWDVLSYLNEHDPEPWPEDIPRDPADPQWTFCFAGEPLFLVARAPCYEARRSRYAEHGLELTVQPRWVFDDLGADTEAGREARQTIRERLDAYDDIARHPDIGSYDDPNSREWKQYLLPTTNEESVARLPFSPSDRED